MRPTWVAIAGGVLTLATTGIWAQVTLPAPVRAVTTVPKASQAVSASPAVRLDSVVSPTENAPKSGESIRVLLTPERETTLSSPVAARIKQLRADFKIAQGAEHFSQGWFTHCGYPLH